VGFIRHRRQAVADGIQRLAPSTAAADDHEAVEECAVHVKELKFQEDKLAKRRIQALREGLLLAKEVTPALQATDVEQRKKDIAGWKRTVGTEQRKIKKTTGGRYFEDWELRGKKVWIEEGLLSAVEVVVVRLAMVISTTRTDANVFVVNNPGGMGVRAQLAAGLLGGYVITPKGFSKQGSSIEYVKPQTSRKVWYSNAFKENYKGVYTVLSTTSGWKALDSMELYVAEKKKKSGKGANVISLVTEAEKDPSPRTSVDP